ncbi:MAG: sulfurtransferase [Proteobacteria bacterium]|nr:sulfurtransferase [Pseudomonadota bacterium]
MTFINISGYRFINLTNLEELKLQLESFCQNQALKGTILLGAEGINAFLSGSRSMIDAFYAFLPTVGFPDMAFKESESHVCPFKYMRVKIKKEIVTMGVFDLDLEKNHAPALSAQMFKQWLEEGKDMIVLDTRNDYEVQLGTFTNAIHLDIKNFRAFPKACEQIAHLKNKTIVTFCTGGIRCEKAAPYLVSQGFTDVYQLDGGILKYLEEFNNAHFEGECFVFDKRIAVDTQLAQTHTVQCHNCRHPVSEQDQHSEYYVEGKSCRNCYHHESFSPL